MDLNSYISGFVDGEGCFCVSFQPGNRHRFGWEVRPSFSVSQNADRAELLYMLQKLWGCGFIRPDRSDKTLKFEVRKIRDLIETVLPSLGFDNFVHSLGAMPRNASPSKVVGGIAMTALLLLADIEALHRLGGDSTAALMGSLTEVG